MGNGPRTTDEQQTVTLLPAGQRIPRTEQRTTDHGPRTNRPSEQRTSKDSPVMTRSPVEPAKPTKDNGQRTTDKGQRTRRATARRRAFTLVELMAVITIIGILLSLVLAASLDADKQARTQATQALIQKLDSALSDRMDALLQSAPNPNWAHGYMGAVYSSLAQTANNPLGMLPPVANISGLDNAEVKTTLRAQTIATYDYIKSELPDVFFIDPNFVANPSSYGGFYPFNFTGVPFLPNVTQVDPNSTGLTSVMLPLGHMVQGPLIGPTLVNLNGGLGDSYIDPNTGFLVSSNPTLGYTGSGIYGASYTAAAGLYKNLGYLPTGYDAVDNNQNGLIDEWAEGVSASNLALVTTHLQNHTHNTARSEMLYALLVEGSGPWGAAFTRDQFGDKEVQDTDNDGLPEFVDGWGQPLQFFRWPILYHSDYQRGQTMTAAGGQVWNLNYPYIGALDTREQDTRDLNQQLTAPGWWSTSGIGGLAANNSCPSFTPAGPPLPANSNASIAVQTFGAFFHRLTEPMPIPPSPVVTGVPWDRGGNYRRAFYSKFLILSAGPNGSPGVFLYSDAALQSLGASASLALIANENNAMQFGLDVADFTATATIANLTIPVNPASPSSVDPTTPTSFDIQLAGQDDITNHSLSAAGGLGGPGS